MGNVDINEDIVDKPSDIFEEKNANVTEEIFDVDHVDNNEDNDLFWTLIALI